VLDLAAANEIEGLEAYADEIAHDALYHPRLIEWAVEQMSHLPRSEVLSDLKALRSEDAQDALREMVGKTLQRMIDSTPKGATAARALERLVVCRGGFTFEAAEAIALDSETLTDKDDLRAALKLLTTWRLIRFEVQSQRYSIPPIVIAGVEADESAAAAHYDYYEALARRHEESADHEKYLKLDAESENLEAAFEWAMGVRDWEKAYWIAEACQPFLENRGRYTQLKDWLERVIDEITDSNSYLWAATQNSLGILYGNYPLGDQRENLRKATLACEGAGLYLKNNDPEGYAKTQNNLGIAYSSLAGMEDRAENLRRAIAAFQEALHYYPPDAAPLYYAGTQNNLGAAYRNLAEVEDRAENLRRAIAAYQEALRFRTPEATPLQYAMTQNNLGIVYNKLAEIEDRAENLQRAITAYQEAMRFYTVDAAPLYYAMTQSNIGIALKDSGDLKAAIECWREAERSYRQHGVDNEADLMVRWIEDGERRLSAGEGWSHILRRLRSAIRRR
jgi:tetratricopeptide (TPR) repeat protein